MGEEIPLERGHQRCTPLEIVILPLLAHLAWKRLQIDKNFLLIMTSTAGELSSGTNIDDLERPWTPKIGVFSEFLAILGCNTHFKTELRRNQDQDNLPMKRSALNVDFNGVRFDPLGSRSPPYERTKFGYPLEKVRFSATVDYSSTKMVADRHRLAAYHNKHSWRAFRGYQHRWPWMTLNTKNMGFKWIFRYFRLWHTLKSEFSLKYTGDGPRQLAYKLNWCCCTSHQH